MRKPSSVSRRRFLAGGAASAGGVLLPAAAQAATRKHKPHPKSVTRKVDVVVVGGGLAGLSAARTLVKSGKSVAVLEARDRVGGRTLNHSLGGGKVVEVGGEFVGPTQDYTIGLANELGVK